MSWPFLVTSISSSPERAVPSLPSTWICALSLVDAVGHHRLCVGPQRHGDPGVLGPGQRAGGGQLHGEPGQADRLRHLHHILRLGVEDHRLKRIGGAEDRARRDLVGQAAGVQRIGHIVVGGGPVLEAGLARAAGGLAAPGGAHLHRQRLAWADLAQLREDLDRDARHRELQAAQVERQVGRVVERDRVVDRRRVAVVEGPVARRDQQARRGRIDIIGQRQAGCRRPAGWA